MGIDAACAQSIIEAMPNGHGRKSVLMLGRQNFGVRPKYFPALNTVLEAQGYDFAMEDVLQADGYSETLFEYLGFERVESLDVSDYEDATHIADLGAELSRDVEDALGGRFDFVFDGGTTEHIFDVAGCFRNVDKILSQSGVFLSVVPLNGWAEHGFFQFGPEVVYGVWQNTYGYNVTSCKAVSLAKPWKRIDLKDHTSLGKRPPLGQGTLPDGRCYMIYGVEKGVTVAATASPMQSFYEKTWEKVKGRKAKAG